MCDRDHSAEDQERYEASGLITRKQFGVTAGSRHRHAAAWSSQRRYGH